MSRVLLMTLCVCLSKWSRYGFGTSRVTYVLFAQCAALQVESCLLSCYNLHMLTLMVNMYLHKCSIVPNLISVVFKTLEVALVRYSSFKEDFLLQTQCSSKCTTFAKLSFKSCRIARSHLGPPKSTHLGEMFYNLDSSCGSI